MKKILSIDDDSDQLTIISGMLSEDYHVIKAMTIHDAIIILRNEVPDLILLDMMLGEEKGMDLFDFLRADDELGKIPVIALTGSAKRDQRSAYLDRGFSDLVVKPARKENLLKSINSVLKA